MEQRNSLRRHEVLVGGALREVRRELVAWHRHRLAVLATGRDVPQELKRLWDDLEVRATELQVDLLQIRHVAGETASEIDDLLHRQGRSRAS